MIFALNNHRNCEKYYRNCDNHMFQNRTYAKSAHTTYESYVIYDLSRDLSRDLILIRVIRVIEVISHPNQKLASSRESSNRKGWHRVGIVGIVPDDANL